jgi:DNA-binding FadR family transcriptional regulator
MILTQPDFITNFERVLDPNLLNKDTLEDLFELRLILEMGMADILFSRIEEKDIEELEKIVAFEETQNYQKNEFHLHIDAKFHGKLYSITKNNTLARFQNLLLPIFEYVYEKYIKNDPNPVIIDPVISHRDLLNHLKIGTPETFRNSMRQHLSPHFNRVLSYYK